MENEGPYVIIGLVTFVVVLSVSSFLLYCYLQQRRTTTSYTSLQVNVNQNPTTNRNNLTPKQKLGVSVSNREGKDGAGAGYATRQQRIYSTPVAPTSPFSNNSGDKFSSSSLSSIGAPKERGAPELWKLALSKANAVQFAGSGSSFRSEKTNTQCVTGKVKFSLAYDKLGQKELTVKIVEFVDLPLSRETGYTIPFVKIYLYPQLAHMMETLKGNNSVETLCFPQENTRTFYGHSYDKLLTCALKLVVLDYDRFSRSEFVAECVVLLDEVALDGETITRHLSIQRVAREEDLGSLLISLCYQPNTSRMCIIVLKASGLPDVGGGHTPDYYVKISLMRGGTIVDKRRTKTVKKSLCPVFNEKLVFPVDCQDVRMLALVLDLIRYDNKLKHEKIASVVLGNHTAQRQVTPHEIQHFNDMLASPHRQIAEWHKIVH